MRVTAGASAAAFISCVVVANIATAHAGLLALPLGLLVPAGTWFAGASLVTRDALQESTRTRWVVACIVIGATLSAVLAGWQLALASGLTFLVAETIDLLAYTAVRPRYGKAAAVAVSGLIGGGVDTALFLALAPGIPLIPATFTGQFIVKGGLSLLAAAAVLAWRRWLR